MVLYAVLALGSTYAENKFSPFPKLCAERAKQAVSFVDDKFSIAVIQARLLLAACNHLIGKNTLGWDLSGSAREIIRTARRSANKIWMNIRGNTITSQVNNSKCRRPIFWTR
jgi:hypothetical protein